MTEHLKGRAVKEKEISLIWANQQSKTNSKQKKTTKKPPQNQSFKNSFMKICN